MKIKTSIALAMCCCIVYVGNAQKMADGYIIGLKKDTIWGQLQVKTGCDGGVCKPFNLAMFALGLKFTDKSGTTKEYAPADIIGFDFDYKEVHYQYRTLKIEGEALQSFQKDDAPTHVLAEMVVNTQPIQLYRFRFEGNAFRKYNGLASFFNYYYNFYAQTPKGLVRINRTFKKDELRTSLKNDLQVEDAFIATLEKDYSVEYLDKIIPRYNEWKATQH